MHPDGLVTELLGGLPIGGQEPPLSHPALPPITLGKPGILKAVVCPGEPAATSHHTHLALPDPALNAGQPRLEVLQPLLLGPPLLASGIPAGPATPPADRHRQSPLDDSNRPTQVSAGVS
jgi:hypothetical protein